MFAHYRKRISVLRELNQKLGTMNSSQCKKRILIDSCDMHPVTVARYMVLIRKGIREGYSPVMYYHGLLTTIAIWGFGSIKQYFIDQVARSFAYKGCEKVKSTKLGITEFLKLIFMPSRERGLQDFEDLILDGIFRAEGVPDLSYLKKRTVSKHYLVALKMIESAVDLVNEADLVVVGHRTYYFRGILYRIAGIQNKGYYIGPRLNNFYIKRLTNRNYRMSIQRTDNEADFLPTGLILPKEENQWLKDVRKSFVNVDFKKFETKVPLLCFHVWTDDNFKGEYNLFENHYQASIQISKKLSESRVPFYYKFHPQTNKYGLKKYIDIVEKHIEDYGGFGVNVSEVRNNLLFPLTSVVVTGNGTVGTEAAASNVPVLCYSDAHYYVKGHWSFPGDKGEFYTKLLSSMDGQVLCGPFKEFLKSSKLPYEETVDFSHLVAKPVLGVDLDKYDINAVWVNSIFEVKL